ncbi:RNA methyltransferase [bacterium]|nr:RNA methyltransferase [bacterium]MBT3903719.1 RNA methyltransferase [bacterium]MBT6528911.1 RNA methyltransferase [bacterium]
MQPTITSLTNQHVKKVRALHAKKGRTQHQELIAQGMRCTQTFFDAGWQATHLYITPEHQHHSITQRCDAVSIVEPIVMQKMSTSKTPSGILATFAIPTNNEPTNIKPGLVLADLHEPGNVGTLIRTSVALDLQNIILIDGCDPWSPKVVQSTSGNIANITIIQTTWQALIEHKSRPTLTALVVDSGDAPVHNKLSQSLLVVGNEAHGLNSTWLASCDQKVTLPMPGKSESLNAAVAGSLAAYLAFLPKQ